jgi:hypothetical protein
VRFELTEAVTPRQFSRLVHSTALPTFQAADYTRKVLILATVELKKLIEYNAFNVATLKQDFL